MNSKQLDKIKHYQEALRVSEKRHFPECTAELMACNDNVKAPEIDMIDKFIWIFVPESARLFFGGHQKWYKRNTAADYGCVPQTVTNCLAMLAKRNENVAEALNLTIQKNGTILYSDFVGLMNFTYKYVGTSEVPVLNRLHDCRKRNKKYRINFKGSLGANYKRCVSGVGKISKIINISLHTTVMLTAQTTYEEGLNFIKNGLVESGAVALLTTKNHHRYYQFKSDTSVVGELKERPSGMTGHAITIIGVSEGEHPLLIASSWGMAGIIEYDDLYQSWQNKAAKISSMVYISV